jgi:WD40 repeat protein
MEKSNDAATVIASNNAPRTDPGRPLSRRRPFWRRLADAVFGYDYFVCYAWTDGRLYAVKVVEELERRGLDCFLDSDDYALSDDWKRVGSWTLRRTGQLLLIGSPAALERPAVLREVRLFSHTDRRIVAVSFDGSLNPSQSSSKLFKYLKGQTLRFEEASARLPIGPSDEAISRISSSFKLVRQRDKRLRLVTLTAVVLAVLALGSVIAAFAAIQARTAAEQRSQANVAQRLAAQSELSRDRFPQRSALLAAAAIEVAQRAGVEVGDAEAAARRTLTAFHGSIPYSHPGLSSMAVSPNRRWLATGGDDNLIRVWDLSKQGAEPRIYRGHQTEANSISFSPDSKWLISGGAYYGRGFVASKTDNRALLWSLSSASATPRALQGKGVAIDFAFVKFGTSVAVLFSDGRVLLWDLTTNGSTLKPVPLGEPNLDAKTIAVDSRGKWLAVGYRNGTARLWKQATLLSKQEAVILPGHDDPVVRTLTFSPNGRWLVTTSTDLKSDSGAPPTTSRTARLWDMNAISASVNARKLDIHSTFHRVWQVNFCTDSKWLMMRSETSDLRLWRMEDRGNPLADTTLRGSSVEEFDELTSAAFSNNCRYVATGSRTGLVHVWRLDSDTPQDWRTLIHADSEVSALAFSGNSRVLFSGGKDGLVRVWDLEDTSRSPVQTLAGHEGEVDNFEFVGNNQALLTASFSNRTVGGLGDETIRRYSLDSSQLPVFAEAILRVPSDGYGSQVTTDHRWIAIMTAYMEATLINVGIKESPSRYSQINGELITRSFSPKNSWLATKAAHSLLLTNLGTSQQVALSGSPCTPSGSLLNVVRDAEFAPDESSVIVADDHSAWLYDLRHWPRPQLMLTIQAPKGYTFVAPGSYLSSADQYSASDLSISTGGQWVLAAWRTYPAYGHSETLRGASDLWIYEMSPTPRSTPLRSLLLILGLLQATTS